MKNALIFWDALSQKLKGLFTLLLVSCLGGGFFYACSSGQAEKQVANTIDQAFSVYVSAYTAGMVSKASDIKIQFTKELVEPEKVGKEVPNGIFSFNPSISGRAYWADARTVAFDPETNLVSGQAYRLTFALGELMEVPEAMERFSYEFSTLPQNFSLEEVGLSTYEGKSSEYQKYVAALYTADLAENAQVERMVSATYRGNDMPISWEHYPEDSRHVFTVEDIERAASGANDLTVKIDGAPIGATYHESRKVSVLGTDRFELLEATVSQSPSQSVLFRFSDRLDPTQDFDGLVALGNLRGLSFQVEGNVLRVYPPIRQTGDVDIKLYQGIKNEQGGDYPGGYANTLSFEQLKPAVRFVGKGSILPSSEGLYVPFEAVGLKAVDVRVIKIFEDNIPQFLQSNDLSGDNQLKRVGRPVAVKRIPLSGDMGSQKWQRYSLDLSEIINAEPGAIYQVTMGFRQAYAAFDCGGSDMGSAPQGAGGDITPNDMLDEFVEQYDQNLWDYYDEYYYGQYDWKNKDNPCSPAYYGGRRNISRNILASDLGLIGKDGGNGKFLATVTDLKTASALQDVNLRLYNYQKQVIAEGQTDANGTAALAYEGKPFLLVAVQGNQRGYLKLADGEALSVSNFDVAGAEVKQGMKGMLYGERGVWRPGDSLYLSFILQQSADVALPTEHPVVFELLDPRGSVVDKQVSNNPTGNFYRFATATPPEALTGNWQAKVEVGGATFARGIRIETVKPNRLKVELDFEREVLKATDGGLNGTLRSEWLHGAPADGLTAEVNVALQAARTAFEGYEGYVFDDRSRAFNTETKEIFKGELNSEGKAGFEAKFDTRKSAPGLLRANFNMRVYEPGGNFSIGTAQYDYHPFEGYVGVKLPEGDRWGYLANGQVQTGQLVRLSANGEKLSGNANVNIYRLDWRWWWNRDYEDLDYYLSRRSVSPVFSQNVQINGGTGQFDFSLDRGGRYFVQACDGTTGHCSGQVFYVGWSSDDQVVPSMATMLSISTDKQAYKVGEEMTISIPGNSKAKAFISIENGTEVLQTHWINTQQGQTNFSLKVEEGMAPNVYVHVTLVQPHGQTENDLPVRLYGILPVLVEDPETQLTPQIEMPEVLAPESSYEIAVSESDGKPMVYTLAVVDEGLLDLTNFKTPDPHGHFYAREALGVTTWDVYDEVIGAFDGKFGRVLAVGGDGSGSGKENAQANRFKPVVTYLGPFQLEKGSKNVHKLEMPNYVGAVKAMVVAGTDKAYGSAHKSVKVKKPVMVLATLPRVLGPGEQLSLPVSVFAMEEGIRNVEVSVKTSELLTLAGEQRKNVSFSRMGDKVVDFPLKVKEGIGVAWVEVTARSGSETATHRIEIGVRNPNPATVQVTEAVIAAGESWETAIQPVGMPGTNSAVLEVSSLPPINLGQRLSYLKRYPYGCVEQTVSSVFPQLFVSNVVELSTEDKQEISTNIKAGIRRIQAFQNADGGLSYWPGTGDGSAWGSIYAYHFLLEAEKKGYSIPIGLSSGLRRNLKRTARRWQYDPEYQRGDLLQAYRLYVLALGSHPETGAMNRLREFGRISLQASWRLAAAYALIGKEKAAEELISDISTNVSPYTEMGYTYGSANRDRAMILETLSLLKRNEEGVKLYRRLSEELSDGQSWLSTQTTAYALIACLKFMEGYEVGKGLQFSYALSGADRVEASSGLDIVQVMVPVAQGGATPISLSNKGEGTLFVRTIAQGVPKTGQEQATSNGLQLSVKYEDGAGNAIDPTAIEQGTNFMASVTVRNPGLQGDYQEMALAQVFPSGWEIINYRIMGNAAPSNKDDGGDFDYRDIRDDRVYTFFDLPAGSQKTFKVQLNASYQGTFYLPAVECAAMYDRTISATTMGQEVKVFGREVAQ